MLIAGKAGRVPKRSFRLFGVLLCVLVAALGATSSASARRPKAPPRVGGTVHAAWPRSGRPPHSGLARWLARQVGPTTVKPCRRRVGRRMVACRRRSRRVKVPPAGISNALRTSAGLAALGDPSGDPAAGAPAAGDPALGDPAAEAPMITSTTTGSPTLALVRSFDIPTDDPLYTSLLNWSWTYDSAITAAAFVLAGDPGESEQLLDQLAALQHTDGSIEIAFNVATGQTESVFRSGTIATVGLAASLYDQAEHTNRYLAMEQRAAGYLISLQGTSGLVRGGPDVGWYSTQHNLLAYSFLVLLGNELISDGNRTAAATYQTAATKIAGGIESNLLVHSGSTAYFIEGLGDSVQALDADALGVMYLESRGETSLAQQVLAYTQNAFALSGRSIAESGGQATFNLTYAANGPFEGFAPYLGTGAPNVLWTEGSAEMMLAASTLGQSTTALARSLDAIAAVTPGAAPLQADHTVSNTALGVEYHVWPAAAAGAWMLLAQLPRAPLFSSMG